MKHIINQLITLVIVLTCANSKAVSNYLPGSDRIYVVCNCAVYAITDDGLNISTPLVQNLLTEEYGEYTYFLHREGIPGMLLDHDQVLVGSDSGYANSQPFELIENLISTITTVPHACSGYPLNKDSLASVEPRVSDFSYHPNRLFASLAEQVVSFSKIRYDSGTKLTLTQGQLTDCRAVMPETINNFLSHTLEVYTPIGSKLPRFELSP